MSYCVNCGVELRDSERKCPLCGTLVVNPNKPFDETTVPAYPRNVDTSSIEDKTKTTAGIISALLTLPPSICLLCNFIINSKISWSLYVIGAFALIWVMVVPPILIRRGTIFWAIGMDVAAILAFLYGVSLADNAAKPWFMPLALPIVIAASIMIIVMVAVIKYGHFSRLYIASIFFICVGFLLIGIELITDPYVGNPVMPEWSLMTLIPCLGLSLIYMLLDRRKRLKNSFKKRFHM